MRSYRFLAAIYTQSALWFILHKHSSTARRGAFYDETKAFGNGSDVWALRFPNPRPIFVLQELDRLLLCLRIACFKLVHSFEFFLPAAFSQYALRERE